MRLPRIYEVEQARHFDDYYTKMPSLGLDTFLFNIRNLYLALSRAHTFTHRIKQTGPCNHVKGKSNTVLYVETHV